MEIERKPTPPLSHLQHHQVIDMQHQQVLREIEIERARVRLERERLEMELKRVELELKSIELEHERARLNQAKNPSWGGGYN